MKETRTPPSPCLGCGKVLDAASSAGHRKKPRPGSISVCIACGHIMAFKKDLTLRELTDKEMLEIAGNPMIIRIMKARAAAVGLVAAVVKATEPKT